MNEAFEQLVVLARRLRGEGGCPWDQEQTLESLQSAFMEEAEEVKQALQNKDVGNLKEELGDVLYTMMLMSLIAEEEGKFSLKEVMEAAHQKIVDRHTWVFGEDRAETSAEALAIWKKNKKKERKKKSDPSS